MVSRSSRLRRLIFFFFHRCFFLYSPFSRKLIMCKINRGIQIINDCESMINMISKKYQKVVWMAEWLKIVKYFFEKNIMYIILFMYIVFRKFLNFLYSNFYILIFFNLFQLFTNSMVEAGLIDNPRVLLASMNELLTLALEKK